MSTTTSRVLVIEDEPSIADNIRYALSTEGFTVEVAHTASAARTILNNQSVDLILLDVGLPDTNGFELAKGILADLTVPIIFVTARSDEIDRVVGLEIGADDYIVKPFSPRELTARVRAVLRRVTNSQKLPSPSTRSYGPFVLNEEKLQITLGEQLLDLSRYEFRLFVVLFKRPGKVYSREQLMQLAWEEPDMSLERTVDTHIKTIRQKLRAIAPAEEYIITHRGIGYSFKELD